MPDAGTVAEADQESKKPVAPSERRCTRGRRLVGRGGAQANPHERQVGDVDAAPVTVAAGRAGRAGHDHGGAGL